MVEAPGRLRQKLEKSCSPRNGSDASRIRARSSASGTHHAYRARNGSGASRSNDRVPIRAPLRRAPRVELVIDELGTADDDLRREVAVDRALQDRGIGRRVDRRSSRLGPRVDAGVGPPADESWTS